MLSVAPWFPLTHHQPLRDGATVALTLGALAVVSSPFVLQAVMADAGSRGPIGDRLVRFAALQDLAGAVLVIPVLIAGRALGSPGGVDIRPAWTWAAQLAGSILAGGVVGVALARAARAIPNDDALVALVAIIALGVAVIGDVSGLEPAIVALAAGATLATWHTVDTERLRGILDRLLAPVVLVWFAMTGAGLRISILRDRDLWPWALLYAGVRYVSLRTGMRWAGRSAMVPPGLARAAPSALVVQGGIAVVLAQVARRAYPEWGVSLAAFIVAIIGVHEVVGAITFRRALVRAGEVLEEQHVRAEPTVADAVPPSPQ